MWEGGNLKTDLYNSLIYNDRYAEKLHVNRRHVESTWSFSSPGSITTLEPVNAILFKHHPSEPLLPSRAWTISSPRVRGLTFNSSHRSVQLEWWQWRMDVLDRRINNVSSRGSYLWNWRQPWDGDSLYPIQGVFNGNARKCFVVAHITCTILWYFNNIPSIYVICRVV